MTIRRLFNYPRFGCGFHANFATITAILPPTLEVRAQDIIFADSMSSPLDNRSGDVEQAGCQQARDENLAGRHRPNLLCSAAKPRLGRPAGVCPA